MNESELKKLVSEWREVVRKAELSREKAWLDHAANQLERLLSADAWTQEPPKEPGWYWYSSASEPEPHVRMIYNFDLSNVSLLKGIGFWKPLHVPELPKT